MTMTPIGANLVRIKEEIEAVCRKVGRHPQEIRLVAVSKGCSTTTIKEVYQAGQSLFAESRVQELTRKITALPPEIAWHFIGTLQRNKVKKIVGKVVLIHSVDSFSLAEEISRQAQGQKRTAALLLQVNIAGEKNKHGFTPLEIKERIREIGQLPHIRVKGLMTMAPLVENPEDVRSVFRELRFLAMDLRRSAESGMALDELSMGMSNDFRVAIEEGATLVRLGSKVFNTENREGGNQENEGIG